jgi:hypothetical protein
VSAVRFRPQPDSISFLRNAPFRFENRESLKTAKVKEKAGFGHAISKFRFGETPKLARETREPPEQFNC